MFYIPLTTSPLGWLILGASGYVLYKTGKKRGQEQAAAQIAPVSETPSSTNTKKGESK